MSLEQVSAHFSVLEFAQPAKPAWGDEYEVIVPYPALWIAERLVPLCMVLEQIRVACGGRAMLVVSGYRSTSYNNELYRRAKKKPTDSQHCYGRAADVVVEGTPPGEVYKKALELVKAKQITLGGAGLYVGFCHFDIRPQKPIGHLATWSGSRTLEQTA